MLVKKTALYEALSLALKVADLKSSRIILSSVHLQATDNILKITATDGSTFLTGDIPCEGDINCTVPCPVLYKQVKPAGKKDTGVVCITDNGGSVTIESDGCTTEFATLPVEDFPDPEPAEWRPVAVWPADPIATAIDYTLPAASTDSTRPRLNGICFESRRIAATDGHRLHVAITALPLDVPFVLPLPASKILRRILKDIVVIARADGRLLARTGNWLLECKLIEEDFPPIDQVIPRNQATQVSVNAALFTRALKQVAGVSSRSIGVNLRVNGVIELSATDPDIGESRSIVNPTSTNHTGDLLDIGFNSAYLLDAIAKRESATLKFDGPLDPITVTTEDTLAVVMPMRI